MPALQRFCIEILQMRYWFKGSHLSLSLWIVRGQSLSAGDAHTAGFCVASWSFWTQQLPGGDGADLWLLGVWHTDRGVVRSTAQGELSWTHKQKQREIKRSVLTWISVILKCVCLCQNDSCVDSVMHYKGELTVVLKYIPAERNISLPLDQVQGMI